MGVQVSFHKFAESKAANLKSAEFRGQDPPSNITDDPCTLKYAGLAEFFFFFSKGPFDRAQK